MMPIIVRRSVTGSALTPIWRMKAENVLSNLEIGNVITLLPVNVGDALSETDNVIFLKAWADVIRKETVYA